ncbi:MAG: heavy metal-associated domain-containing protein [Bacteroidetes bacterium]|nr:MAG: heavy metal-associated domain-containing protein [Bacteroidota bacterium]
MLNWISAYLGELLHLLHEMSPYLLLGFLFAGGLRVLFPRQMINRYMGGRDFRSVMNAALMGIPMPLCSCGVLPAAMGFYRNGASRGASISFLVSTPQTGVDSILATYSLLGWPMAIIRPVAALVSGLFGGLLGNRLDRKEGVQTEMQDEGESDVPPRSLVELLRYGFVELIQDLGKWLVIGLLLAALLAMLIPADFFIQHVGNPFFEMGLILLLSVPLYICATGSIPIAAVLMLKGLSPGAALVLLMAGPATNIATMTVIASTMGRKSLWVYLSSIIGGAVLFGVAINNLLPVEWIAAAFPVNVQPEHYQHGQNWLSWLSSVMLVVLLLNGQLQKWLSKRKQDRSDRAQLAAMNENVRYYKVEGMTCQHCKANVESGLSELEGVERVLADPGENRVSLQAENIDDELVAARIAQLGYNYLGRTDVDEA